MHTSIFHPIVQSYNCQCPCGAVALSFFPDVREQATSRHVLVPHGVACCSRSFVPASNWEEAVRRRVAARLARPCYTVLSPCQTVRQCATLIDTFDCNRQTVALAVRSTSLFKLEIEIARDWYRSQNGRDCGAKV